MINVEVYNFFLWREIICTLLSPEDEQVMMVRARIIYLLTGKISPEEAAIKATHGTPPKPPATITTLEQLEKFFGGLLSRFNI